jgi:HSP20 family protein
MFLTRWQPLLQDQFNRLQQEMNRVFDELNWDGGPPAFSVAYPALNVWEDDSNVYVEAELPGMTQDQLHIYVTQGDQLTIKGERTAGEPRQGTWHRQERGFGKFQRVVTLPVPVDADKVEAKLENGVLLLTLPKAETARPRRIAVKSD